MLQIGTLIEELEKTKEILAFKGDGKQKISSITYDSRKVTKGALFIAVKGDSFDGHDYIEKAVSSGAAFIILQNPEKFKTLEYALLVPDSRACMAKVANLFYDYPSRRMKVIGITGTNGKTTTSYILNRILENSSIKCGMLGTIIYKVGNREIIPPNTTPEAIDIAGYLDEMIKGGQNVAVMEVSSHALALNRVAGMKFEIGIFTNLTRDHLDFHGDMNSYFNTKKLLFNNSSIKGIVNMDDPYASKLINESKANFTGYGLEENSQVKAVNANIGIDGIDFTVQLTDSSFKCRSPLTGKHNLYNNLAAITASLELGLNVEDIQKGVEQNFFVPGRFEVISTSEKVNAVLDYAHTDDALKNLLSAVKEVTCGKIITVFGCGGDRDKGKRPLMGKIASLMSDFVIVTSDNPRSEDPSLIISEILTGISDRSTCREVLDRREAIKEAVAMACQGDTIVLAGKGHENYQILPTGKIDFDDKEEIIRAMQDVGLDIQHL